MNLFVKWSLSTAAAFTVAAVALFGVVSVTWAAVVSVEEIHCQYNPDSGQPNPFGFRAFISVTQTGADTVFRYVHFPRPVQLEQQGNLNTARAVTVENTRTMVFYNTGLEVARGLMRMNNDYYYELIGYVDKAGFSSYDEAMICV